MNCSSKCHTNYTSICSYVIVSVRKYVEVSKLKPFPHLASHKWQDHMMYCGFTVAMAYEIQLAYMLHAANNIRI